MLKHFPRLSAPSSRLIHQSPILTPSPYVLASSTVANCWWWTGLARAVADVSRRGTCDKHSLAQSIRPETTAFSAKAKAVIWIFVNGGASQVDTWNYRPALEKYDGQPLPDFDTKTGFFPDQVGGLMKSPFKWAQHGESGTWASELFPHLSKHVDKMSFIHSCYTNSNNHSPALFMMNTGCDADGQSVRWFVGHLWFGFRKRKSAQLCRDVGPVESWLAQGKRVELGRGFLAECLSRTWLKPSGEPIDNLKPRRV